MPIIRANDPHANDTAYQVCSVLGKMCAVDLSSETKHQCVEKLTKLLQGQTMSSDTFKHLGIDARIIDTGKDTEIHIHVPKKFVAAGITEDRDNQWIVFKVNRALNIDDLGNSDTAIITDMKGNLITDLTENDNKSN